MPCVDYKCEKCGKTFEELLKWPIPTEIPCKECDGVAYKQLSAFGRYSIKGNNSASVTPKKFRGGQ